MALDVASKELSKLTGGRITKAPTTVAKAKQIGLDLAGEEHLILFLPHLRFGVQMANHN